MTMSKYYLFYRIDDGEWKSIRSNCFLTNESVSKIYGQFISSSWFSLEVTSVQHVDFKVVKICSETPRNIHPTYFGMLCEQLNNNNDPDNVVCCERFDLIKIRKHLHIKYMSENQDQMIYQELHPQMGATFHMIRSGPESVDYMMSCPTFVIPKN